MVKILVCLFSQPNFVVLRVVPLTLDSEFHQIIGTFISISKNIRYQIVHTRHIAWTMKISMSGVFFHLSSKLFEQWAKDMIFLKMYTFLENEPYT